MGKNITKTCNSNKTIVKKGHPREVWFVIMEGFVTIILSLDIVIRIYLEGKVEFRVGIAN
jgi:hypothetical protein